MTPFCAAIVFILLIAFGDAAENGQDDISREQVNEVVKCYKDRYNSDVYKDVDDVTSCLKNVVKEPEWKEDYCRHYENNGFPSCFNDDVISRMKSCLSEDGYEMIHKMIKNINDPVCVRFCSVDQGYKGSSKKDGTCWTLLSVKKWGIFFDDPVLKNNRVESSPVISGNT